MNHYERIIELITESILINERSREAKEKRRQKKKGEEEQGREIDGTIKDPNPERIERAGGEAYRRTVGSPTEKRIAGVRAIHRVLARETRGSR